MNVGSKDFRVVFVNLKTGTPCYFAGLDFTLEHIGIGYLTSTLRKNVYDAAIIDAATEDLSEKEVVQRVLGFSPAMVGFSPTIATMESTIRVCGLLKKVDRVIHICLGGHHATFLAEELLLKEPCFDSVIRGEGELTIMDLAHRLSLELPLAGASGVYFRDRDGNICKNPGRDKVKDLDSIPFPARDTLKWQVQEKKSRTARVITSRGCAAKCSFCSIPPFERLQDGRLWRARSPENILAELTSLKEEFGVKTILFAEDNFIGPGKAGRERVRQIAEGMINRRLGLRFRILTTAESLINCEHLLPLLKKAGLDRVIVGIESASPSALEVFNKRTTLGQNYRVVRMLAQHNIVLHLGFMMFHPYASFDDLRLNAEFLKDIDQACFFQYFSNRMELYPGVAILKKLKEEGMILSKSDYKRGFLYRYAEPRMEKLARGLSPVRRKMVDVDRSLMNIDIWLSHNNGEGSEGSNSSFINDYTELRKEFSSKNMGFFLRSVELAESGWNSEAFEGLKGEYFGDVEELGDTLRLMVESSGELLEYFGLTSENIVSATKEVQGRKVG